MRTKVRRPDRTQAVLAADLRRHRAYWNLTGKVRVVAPPGADYVEVAGEDLHVLLVIQAIP